MTATRIKVVWTADGPDRPAHAWRPRAVRTLCDRRPTPERFAWPASSRCAACRAELERLEAAT